MRESCGKRPRRCETTSRDYLSGRDYALRSSLPEALRFAPFRPSDPPLVETDASADLLPFWLHYLTCRVASYFLLFELLWTYHQHCEKALAESVV